MQELASISERNLAPILTLLVASWRGPTVTIKNKERTMSARDVKSFGEEVEASC